MDLYSWAGSRYRDLSPTLYGVYLSNWDTATQATLWEDYQFKVIITLSTENHNPTTLADMRYLGICHYLFALADEPEAPLKDYLTQTYHIIDEAVGRRERVLVHCQMGVSRSAAVVLAYFMRRFQCFDMKKAHADLATFRPSIGINQGFRQQISAWLQENRDEEQK